MGYRQQRQKKVKHTHRTTAEASIAQLKARLRHDRTSEAASLLRVLYGEIVNSDQWREARAKARELVREDTELAREVLQVYRGDKPVRDEPEFELSGCYFDERPGLRSGVLVNVDDMTGGVRRVLGALLVPA